MARAGGAITINFDEESVARAAAGADPGKGPRSASRRSGGSATRAGSFDSMIDKAKQTVMLGTIGRTCCAR